MNLILQLRNKNKKNEITDFLNFNENSQILILENFLNSQNKEKKKFLFYFNNLKLDLNLFLIDIYNKNKISYEDNIIIDYIIINNNLECSKITCDFLITDFKIFNKIFFITYNNLLGVFKDNNLNKNFSLISFNKYFDTNIFKNIDGHIFLCKDFPLAYYRNYIFDLINKKIIKIEYEIINLSKNDLFYFICTNNKKIIALDDNFNFIFDIDTKKNIDLLKSNKKYIFYLEENNLIKFNTIKKKFRTFYFVKNITNFFISEEIYLSTSKNTIYKIKEGEISEYKINYRLIDLIKKYKDIFILISQNKIIFYNKEFDNEIFNIVLENKVNYIEIINDDLIIVYDKNINIYNINKLISK